MKKINELIFDNFQEIRFDNYHSAREKSNINKHTHTPSFKLKIMKTPNKPNQTNNHSLSKIFKNSIKLNTERPMNLKKTKDIFDRFKNEKFRTINKIPLCKALKFKDDNSKIISKDSTNVDFTELQNHLQEYNTLEKEIQQNNINRYHSKKNSVHLDNTSTSFFKNNFTKLSIRKKNLSTYNSGANNMIKKDFYLTTTDKNKMLNIYRKGIDKKNISILLDSTNTKLNYSRYTKKEPISRILLKSDKYTPLQRINNDFKTINNAGERNKRKNVDAMKKEISIKCSQNFQLSQPKKFTKTFQICHDAINIDKDEELQKMLNKLVSKNKLRTDVNKELEIIRQEVKIEKRKDLFLKWKRCIITAAIHFKKLNLTMKEFLDGKSQAMNPYEGDGSYELIQAVKNGDSKTVVKIVLENKFLVHDFDHFYQTALHWAAKRNRFAIIPILIKQGANVNAEDVSGRTPLHVAAQKNHLDALKILLYEMADPFKKSKEGKMPVDLTTDNKCKFFLSRARILHIIHKFVSVKNSQQRIKFGFEFFFNQDEKKTFNLEN